MLVFTLGASLPDTTPPAPAVRICTVKTVMRRAALVLVSCALLSAAFTLTVLGLYLSPAHQDSPPPAKDESELAKDESDLAEARKILDELITMSKEDVVMMNEVARATPADIARLTATDDSRRLYESIVECFPPTVSEFFELFEHAPCYEDLVNEAARSYSPRDLLNAVKALVAHRPDVLTACHNGGHSAAAILTERIWDPRAPYEVQLSQMRQVMGAADDVCQNGYVHGFYDAIGKDDPNDDSFRAAAEICYEVVSSTVDCGHGLGHSAWYATKDFKKAAMICGVLKDYLKYRCDDGVIMYLPDYWSQAGTDWSADPRKKSWDADKFYKDSVEVCTWWPTDRPNDDDPLRGCWSGIVAGVLWRPITTLIDYGNYKDVATEAKQLVRRAEAACAELGPRGEAYCIKEWPGMVLYVAQNNRDNIKDLCSAMVRHRDFCTERSLLHLEENLDRDTEISRVGQ